MVRQGEHQRVVLLHVALENGFMITIFFSFFLLFFSVLEEGGVKMKLTVIDTPGFGDQINNDNW